MKFVNSKILRVLIAAFCASVSSNTLAFNSLSRACNMLELHNAGVLLPAIYFFNMVGMPDYFTAITRISNQEKELYWVNESFTSDPNPIPRYYLYAENRVYIQQKGGQFGPHNSSYTLYKTYQSGYDSKRYSELARQDRINQAIMNRHLLFWAGAGENNIIDKLPGTYNVKVFGYHYAIDPHTKAKLEIAPSQASNCNTLQWPL